MLTGEAADAVDVRRARRGARPPRRALERWTAARLVDDGAARVVDRFRAVFPLRRLSFAAVGIAGDASLAAHDVVRSPRDAAAALARAGAALRAHCNRRSVRFRNTARAGLGLALAVLVAKTASVEHEFWVVLGALAVLRSNALGTGATALQALVGALLGFGVASAVMLTVGADDTVLWILLPLVVFLAAYTPGAVNFVVGQASFTVFVVVLFNILTPQGWRTGLVRVQDVAIGAGISVVVGALLWPRGARGITRRAFADLLRAGADHVRLALGATLDGRPPAEAVRAGVSAADARAIAPSPRWRTSRSSTVAGRSTGRRGARCSSTPGCSDSPVTASPARVRGTRSARGCGPARATLAEEGGTVCTQIDQDADLVERTGVAGTAAARPTPPCPCRRVWTPASRPTRPTASTARSVSSGCTSGWRW